MCECLAGMMVVRMFLRVGQEEEEGKEEAEEEEEEKEEKEGKRIK